jgi:hypothetical protein
MLREDGTPYPEDEDDEILREMEGELFDAAWTAYCATTENRVVVPGQPDPDEVLRQRRLEFVCPSCWDTHAMRFVYP